MSYKLSGKLVGLCLLAACTHFSAQAKDSARLNIHGSIIPAACNFTIDDEDADFSGLTEAMMKKHDTEGVFTARELSIPFTIACSSAQKVALSALADMRPATPLDAFPTYESSDKEISRQAKEQISLAQDSSGKDFVVGTVMVNADDISVDNTTAKTIWETTDAGASWTHINTKRILVQDNSVWYGFSDGPNGNINDARNISGRLIVTINASADSVTKMSTSIQFSGGTTFTLHYI